MRIKKTIMDVFEGIEEAIDYVDE